VIRFRIESSAIDDGERVVLHQRDQAKAHLASQNLEQAGPPRREGCFSSPTCRPSVRSPPIGPSIDTQSGQSVPILDVAIWPEFVRQHTRRRLQQVPVFSGVSVACGDFTFKVVFADTRGVKLGTKADMVPTDDSRSRFIVILMLSVKDMQMVMRKATIREYSYSSRA